MWFYVASIIVLCVSVVVLYMFSMACQSACGSVWGSGCEFGAVAFCLQIEKKGEGQVRARMVES